jgi:ribosomal protein S18 acetylase RimI-like enzyme
MIYFVSKEQKNEDLKLVRYFSKKDLLKFTKGLRNNPNTSAEKLNGVNEKKIKVDDNVEMKEVGNFGIPIENTNFNDAIYPINEIHSLNDMSMGMNPVGMHYTDYFSNPDDFTFYLNDDIYQESMINHQYPHYDERNIDLNPITEQTFTMMEIDQHPVQEMTPVPKVTKQEEKFRKEDDKTFNEAVDKYFEISSKAKVEKDKCVADFYASNPELIPTFRESIFGDETYRLRLGYITSPYSQRILKPFIHRDYQTQTKKQNILCELMDYFYLRNPKKKPHKPAPIDYVYLKPNYLKQINNLLTDEFWPGIDISNNLIDPEHTIVALYKQLVVGCGFITEEGYISYIAVHQEWRGAKIAQFMLYHLIQTCPDKHITLHVSVNNQALLLYNKFGFKPEQYILEFYAKYIPKESLLSKNAFMMRLRR